MTEPIFEITKSAAFDAAHSLPDGPRSEYRRLHGHSFQVEATVRGPITGPVGWVEDLGRLDEALKSVADELDHGHLNEVRGLENPTLERLCMHFAERLRARFPGLSRIAVSRPTVGERCVLDLLIAEPVER
jgi:6-pyruvoyltetrahydropterin/6-carboxytetrahydropterin synthase